jgi:class 3 adenylate cyclase
MSLFVSARQRKEYLSFAMFCLFGAVSYILSTVDIGFLYNLESFAGIFCFEFLAMFLCQVLLRRDRSIWPLMVIMASLCICALPAVRYYYATAVTQQAPIVIGAVYLLLYPFTVCSVLYYLIQGVGKKQWEVRAIVLVCLVPIIAFVVAFIAASIFAGFKIHDKQMQYAWIVPIMMSYLSAGIVYMYPLSAVYIVGRRNMQTQATLEAQVVSIGKLSEENLEKEKEKQHILEHQKEDLEREVSLRTAEVVTQKEEIERQHDELKVEKKKSDDLLRNILPEEVAAELKAKGHSEAKLFDNVTVLFTDFVNFTIAGEQMTPQALIDELHTCFKAFDEITVKYNLEKIKTIGDAYLAVCGLPVADYKHAEKVVSAAKEINAFMQQRVAERGSGSFNIRIGVHSGPVVAGIVGVKKFAYDVWGDTVNTAARLEQKGEPGKINISESTYQLVKGAFTCEYRGEIAAKNKGPMKMYFVQ